MSRKSTSTDPAHEALLEFEYDDSTYARIVERSVRQELHEIDGDRARATLERDGSTLTVTVRATDLVALRAGTNTWLSLVSVAQRCAAPTPTRGVDLDR